MTTMELKSNLLKHYILCKNLLPVTLVFDSPIDGISNVSNERFGFHTKLASILRLCVGSAFEEPSIENVKTKIKLAETTYIV